MLPEFGIQSFVRIALSFRIVALADASDQYSGELVETAWVGILVKQGYQRYMSGLAA